ncbi:MAG: hypothetical protein ACREQM_11935, partial [Candidatus Dormibacteraceae bacterium]
MDLLRPGLQPSTDANHDGKGDERDLVRGDAREDGEERGREHPLRDSAVEVCGDRPVQRLPRRSQEVAAALSVVARRVDIEPPLLVTYGQRPGATRVGQHLDGTGEAGVAGGHRRFDGAAQGRAADEGTDVEGLVHRELLANRSEPPSESRTFVASMGSTPIVAPNRVSTATTTSPGPTDTSFSYCTREGRNTRSAITMAKGSEPTPSRAANAESPLPSRYLWLC